MAVCDDEIDEVCVKLDVSEVAWVAVWVCEFVELWLGLPKIEGVRD